jgi:transposase InsO family protein
MRCMGLQAIYRKPLTTVPGEPSERFPCLVDVSTVTVVDQVWATDITYIPLHKGFFHLVAIVDPFSRSVLSWELSDRLYTEFCLDALEMAPEGGPSQGSSTLIKGASSPPPTSWPAYRPSRSRSAGLGGNVAMTISLLSDCVEWSNTRRSTFTPIAMAGRLIQPGPLPMVV